MTTGKDFDYIRDHYDLPRIKALNEYHTKFPPADVGIQRLCRILEAFMGIEDNSNPQDEDDDEDDLEEMLNAFQQG